MAFLVEAISGFILWLVLPHGRQYGGGGTGFDSDEIESTFIWARQTWLDIHDWAAVALLVIIFIHIYMHWRWLYRQVKGIVRPR